MSSLTMHHHSVVYGTHFLQYMELTSQLRGQSDLKPLIAETKEAITNSPVAQLEAPPISPRASPRGSPPSPPLKYVF